MIPTGNAVIRILRSHRAKVYQELFQSAVGLAGAAQNFDGNGRYVRATAGGGHLVQTPAQPVNGPLFGNAVLAPLGTRPGFARKAPPLRATCPCSETRRRT